MGTFALNNAKILLGGYNLSGFHNSLTVDYGAEMLDDTVFGNSGTRSFKPGLKTVGFEGNIFWDDVIDGAVFPRIQAVREVMSFAAEGVAEGDVAYTTRMVNGTYSPGGEVGALLAGTFNGSSANTPFVRGKVLALGVKSGVGNGTSFQLGAVPTGGKVYAAVHNFGGVGTSVTVKIQSGASDPATVDRITGIVAAANSATWAQLVGPITDTWWRAHWTPTSNPNIYVVVGII